MASLSTCHLGLWLGWQILLNLVNENKLAFVLGDLETLRSTVESKLTVVYNQFV